MTAKDFAVTAATAHANLNTWGAVVALLEGGTLSGASTHAAQQRVIKVAKVEMRKHLDEYDAALRAIEEVRK